MKLDPHIQREVDKIPVLFTIERKTRHYFLVVAGQPRICLGSHGTHDPNYRLVKLCACNIRRMNERLIDAQTNTSAPTRPGGSVRFLSHTPPTRGGGHP